MLEELETCFQAIDMQTKLKIISCIPHMNPRKMSTVHNSITVLLELASKDADDWVETIADMYRDIPSTGVIIPSCSSKNSHFAKALEDMTKCFQKHHQSGSLKLSPEAHNIVSGSVNKAIFGASPEPQKLFILRKKPKSFKLMNDMMKLPMKGIRTQNPCKLNSGFTYEPKKFQRQLMKREGGAKLLDICELPQSLKRRRQLEMIEEKKRKQVEKEMARKKALEEKKEKELAKKEAQPKHFANSKRQCEKKHRLESVENQSANDGDGQVSCPNVSETAEQLKSAPSMFSSGDAGNLQAAYPTEQKWELDQERNDVPESVFMFHEPLDPISQRAVQNSNPRPELGNVITMKLSETIEDGLANNQICKMKVETFFQMDYQSGEWKRLRKCRLLQPHELPNISEQYMYVSTDEYRAQAQQQPT
ncbi:unnamed protein product [Angiostrongylus costaricensis]|uniref:HDAg domain-containing protein n=1 Tax=Angiostrongylus costaricensis TaxID=334426 RepID=A0A0R3PNF7_ANGCS|nr:unnamed protein product [Angiostrongylus costaricensis]